MAELKKSTARNRLFKMIDSSDHISLKTGADPVVNLNKNAGSWAVAAGEVTEIGNGWYSIALTTVDTDTLGDLGFYITGTGADDTDFCDQVTANLLDDLAVSIATVMAHLPPTPPTPTQIANAIFATMIETGFSFTKVMQILGASVGGLSSAGPNGFNVSSLSQDRTVMEGTSDFNGNRLTVEFP
jgi:hypothetical protein